MSLKRGSFGGGARAARLGMVARPRPDWQVPVRRPARAPRWDRRAAELPYGASAPR